MRLGGLLAALALAIPVLAQAAESDTVKVDAQTQRRLGVVVAPVVAGTGGGAATGFARVIDPGPLLVLEADLDAAEAAATASRAEARRLRALHQADATASTHSVEVAEAQARTDEAKLTLLRRRLGLEWGPTFQRLGGAARASLVARLAAGQAALLRIDGVAGFPGGASAAEIMVQGRPIRARILGPARTSDPRTQAGGLVGEVDGPAALSLPVGLSAPASLVGRTGDAGFVLPRSALYRTGGQTVVFVRTTPEQFQRRVVVGGVSAPEGLFVHQGFRAGEPIVVQGAAALAAAQSPPAGEAD